jgi:vitamin B12 transporter
MHSGNVFSRFILLLFLISPSGKLFALTQEVLDVVSIVTGTDSLRAYRMGEITVTASMLKDAETSAAPLQALNQTDLKGLSVELVPDALKFFSGVVVKDYGGAGGMKTLSIRSLGAHHTAVSYDGIVLTDCQTGQLDLSKFSLDNVDLLSLSIGDGNTIFQPARAFAASGLLTIRTKRPEFSAEHHLKGMVRAQLGSFGTQQINGSLGVNVFSSWALSFNGQYLHSDGDYPYRIQYGNTNGETLHRTNNETTSFRFESNVAKKLRESGLLELKVYHYNAQKALPGAVILYNPTSNQRLWDNANFVQAHVEDLISKKLSWQFNAKYNQTRQRYLNPDYLDASGEEDDRYSQREGYVSSVFNLQSTRKLSFAWASDGAVASMDCNVKDFAVPIRYTFLNNLAVKYVDSRVVTTASILATGMREATQTGTAGSDIARLSPSINVSVQPFSALSGLRIRSFWKNSFRPPSFNDLYYSALGNTNLKPENSNQVNLGITYGQTFLREGSVFGLSIDLYHNELTNKIMALPTRNMFVWSMTNLGRVEVNGLDLNAHVRASILDDIVLQGTWNHSYQRALDMTDRNSKTYNQQIAYTPRVYGSARMGVSYKKIDLGYSMIYSGHRYVTGQNLVENDLPGYTEHSMSMGYAFKQGQLDWTLRMDVQNLWATSYEIVRNFPMPGRAFRVSLQLEF